MKTILFPILGLTAILFAATSHAAKAKDIRLLTKTELVLCEPDRKALCVDVKKSQLVACLINNADQIQDPDCKNAVQNAKGRVESIKQACQFDIDTKCRDMDIGTGLFSCLLKKQKELTGSCKKELRQP